MNETAIILLVDGFVWLKTESSQLVSGVRVTGRRQCFAESTHRRFLAGMRPGS